MTARPVQAAPIASVAAPAVPAAKGGSGLKILLIILCIVGAIGAAVIGGTIYVGYRVKQTVTAKAKSYGVDLDSIGAAAASAGSRSTSASSAPRRKPCAYLSKDEVSRILGQPIERAVAEESACQYFGPPGLAAKLGQQGMSTGMQQLQANQPPNAQIAQGLNNLINGMAAQGGEERPLLLITIDPDGRGQMTALNIAGGLFGGIPGAKPVEISGLGDRAVRFANLGLNIQKGNTVIRIVAGPIPDPDNKTLEIAKALLPMV